MKIVEVNTGSRYNIIINRGILENSGELIEKVTEAKTIAVITDDIVDSLYSRCVMQSLEKQGFKTVKFVFRNGEKSKNICTFAEILEFLAENELTRSDAVVALGGGVVGDMAGFAAASYLRGIDLIQIPTTLLACVDSSVGGKTAVDLNAGKNLAGAFYQPRLVLCDYNTLNTLPDRVFSDGMAEVIKYGAIFDKAFFEFLYKNDAKQNLEYVITRCVEMKRDIVNADETEKGSRALLNFGHTVGHAIEKCSDFKISHGSAVAIGMVMAARGAFNIGICKEDCSASIIELNRKYDLPDFCDFPAEQLYRVTLSDKKRDGNFIKLIIPKAIGECVIYKTETANLLDFIKKGLN